MVNMKLNGSVKWILLTITISMMVVTFFVRAALVEERLGVMDTTHKTAIEVAQRSHDKDIGYIQKDVAEIKKDVKEILKKL